MGEGNVKVRNFEKGVIMGLYWNHVCETLKLYNTIDFKGSFSINKFCSCLWSLYLNTLYNNWLLLKFESNLRYLVFQKHFPLIEDYPLRKKLGFLRARVRWIFWRGWFWQEGKEQEYKMFLKLFLFLRVLLFT